MKYETRRTTAHAGALRRGVPKLSLPKGCRPVPAADLLALRHDLAREARVRFASILPSLVGWMLALCLAAMPAGAADLGPAPSTGVQPGEVELHEALSRYLSLQMIRATFDVVPRDDLEPALEEQAARWGNAPPSAGALSELDQQLQAEASYYLVSLSYLVQVGGAVFPADRAEMVYVNDTVSELEDLRRQLVEAIADGGDVLPVLVEAERIRALTEGYQALPTDFGVFAEHDTLLGRVLEERRRGTPA